MERIVRRIGRMRITSEVDGADLKENLEKAKEEAKLAGVRSGFVDYERQIPRFKIGPGTYYVGSYENYYTFYTALLSEKPKKIIV